MTAIKRSLQWIPIALLTLVRPSFAADDQQNLHYVESETTLELTVLASGIWLVIPSEGFERIRPVESGAPGPRSFDLVDHEQGVEIYGAFDSNQRYPGLNRIWAEERQQMTLEGAPEPRNIQITREKDWDLVAYDTSRDGSVTSHLRAHIIRDQTWIDVHVSVTGAAEVATLRERALGVLRGLILREE